jgi:hypothetical protein
VLALSLLWKVAPVATVTGNLGDDPDSLRQIAGKSSDGDAADGQGMRGNAGGNAALTLRSDVGEIVISGNTANGVASGIHFGRAGGLRQSTGYFGDSKTGTAFTVLATNHDIRLEDPVTVELYNASENADFTMTVKAGKGTFAWGGKNVFDANGGASVMFLRGKTVFLKDFTLGATKGIEYRTGSATDAYARVASGNALKVTLESGTDLALSSTRDATVALFDFTGSTSNGQAGNFTVESGARMSLRQESNIAAGTRYLIAGGIADKDGGDAVTRLTAGTGIDHFETAAHQVWAVATEYILPQ